jgi:small-conductance mechanosensitive channel
MIQAGELLKDFTQIDFVSIFLIAVVAWFLNRFVHWFFPWLAERAPSRFRLYLLPAVPLLKLAIIAAAILSILPLIIDPTPERLLVAISAAAIALGFALQEYASSLIAGVVTVFERPYRVGDWVQIEDAYGEVISVGFRAVQLLTADDSTVLIPQR